MYDLYFFIVAQIVLESFPISSSGHVRLFELAGFNVGLDHVRDQIFQHFLHGPTALVLALFFRRRWVPLVMRLRCTWPMAVRLMLLVGVADVLTALFYCAFAALDMSQFPLGVGFCITAAMLASLRFCVQSINQRFALNHAVVLGVVQGFALLPGISRMAITYGTARWLRFSPRASFELSCAIQWPLIAAAFLKSFVQLIQLPQTDPLRMVIMTWPTLLVIVASSVVAWLGVRLVYQWMLHNVIWRLSFYMIIPFVAWIVLSIC